MRSAPYFCACVAKNKVMRKIVSTFRYYSDKRFSTIAGTLVYFLLMSIAPFLLWLTLLLGSFDLQGILSADVFESISPFLNYLKDSAQSAASGAGIILLVTSLYSSTNFFYHLRRSGEIIYGSSKVKGGIKLRIISVIYIILTILLFALLGSAFFAARFILRYILPDWLAEILLVLFAAEVGFGVAVLLNLVACPYKLKIGETLTGSLLTVVLWMGFIAGFAVYVRFGSPAKLYGAIASVIIFLLWCYAMMCCLVVGMINNGSYKRDRQHKKLL